MSPAELLFCVMLRVNVGLLSGRTEVLEVERALNVRDLKVLAQNSFQRAFLKLVTAGGRPLVDLDESLEAAGIQDKDLVTAVPLQAQLAANDRAFAPVVSWRRPRCDVG